MEKGRKSVSRRSLFLAGAAGLAWLASKAASAAWAQQKLSREEAHYRDSPEDIRMCATCSLFLAPNACKVVEGEVSPSGWCKLYDFAD